MMKSSTTMARRWPRMAQRNSFMRRDPFLLLILVCLLLANVPTDAEDSYDYATVKQEEEELRRHPESAPHLHNEDHHDADHSTATNDNNGNGGSNHASGYNDKDQVVMDENNLGVESNGDDDRTTQQTNRDDDSTQLDDRNQQDSISFEKSDKETRQNHHNNYLEEENANIVEDPIKAIKSTIEEIRIQQQLPHDEDNQDNEDHIEHQTSDKGTEEEIISSADNKQTSRKETSILHEPETKPLDQSLEKEEVKEYHASTEGETQDSNTILHTTTINTNTTTSYNSSATTSTAGNKNDPSPRSQQEHRQQYRMEERQNTRSTTSTSSSSSPTINNNKSQTNNNKKKNASQTQTQTPTQQQRQQENGNDLHSKPTMHTQSPKTDSFSNDKSSTAMPKMEWVENDEASLLDVFGAVAQDFLTHRMIPPTDATCKWHWKHFRCESNCYCSFQPQWGDYHLGRSCRKITNINPNHTPVKHCRVPPNNAFTTTIQTIAIVNRFIVKPWLRKAKKKVLVDVLKLDEWKGRISDFKEQRICDSSFLQVDDYDDNDDDDNDDDDDDYPHGSILFPREDGIVGVAMRPPGVGGGSEERRRTRRKAQLKRKRNGVFGKSVRKFRSIIKCDIA